MDIDLARTFLEVVRSNSFIAAAERLHVTQTTVTARIQNLEGQLGCRLFVRNRSGARLTDNGEQFTAYASQLVQTWEAARRNLPLPQGKEELLTIGAEISLWNPLLLNWLGTLRHDCPDLAVRTEVRERQMLHEKLQHGVLDAALVHQPDYWPGMQVEQLLEEKLVLVQSIISAEPYIFVDWGESFRRQHDTALPQYVRATLNLNLGPLALYYILEHGGSGYFRTRVVQRYVREGSLQRVSQSPEFTYPIYLVYNRGKLQGALQRAVQSLRQAIAKEEDW